MKRWWNRHKKWHLWLLTDLVLLAAFFLLRPYKPLMNALADHVTTPIKTALAVFWSGVSVSAAEVMYLIAVAAVIFWATGLIRALVQRSRRGETIYRYLLGALCAALTIWAGFCLLWGVNYHTDTFQDRSGIVARQGTVEELTALTAHFSEGVSRAASEVPRDENGLFCADRRAILDSAVSVYESGWEEFPSLQIRSVRPKEFVCSKAMSAMDFTGFYWPFTGEANVNMDSPAAFLPSTAIHEMAHQRQIASEQECNFVAIAVCIGSEDPLYRYSGWLMGYVHVSNALYRVDREAWQRFREGLPDTVRADIQCNNDYWNAAHTSFTDTAQSVYDSFIKTNGDPNGVRSYGMVVDLLLAYYG